MAPPSVQKSPDPRAGDPKGGQGTVGQKSTSGSGSRRFWFDGRFLVGILLVAASVVAVVGIVTAADRTVEVYAAPAALSPGDRVSIGALESRFVRLDGAESVYLSPATVPSSGLTVVRPITAGELIPLSAVGQSASQRVASVVIPVTTGLPASIGPNAVVDVWGAAEVEHGRFGPPSVLVSSATVVRVLESTGFIAGSSSAGVELLVTRDRLARVLEAVANGSALSLVPVSIPVGLKANQ